MASENPTPAPQPSLPEADRLEVLLLVDNVTDQLSTNPAHVHSEREILMGAGMKEWGGEAICCAHFGLSLLLTAHAGGASHTVLFDAGPEAYAVERNADRLKADLGSVSEVVLSHGHWDHAGGLPKAFELIGEGNGGREVPCHLHPGMFDKRAFLLPDGSVLPFRDVPTPEELAA